MAPAIETFIESLHALTPAEADDYLQNKLYALTAPLESLQQIEAAIPHIFRFFEANPEADFGTPGPLVHLLEKHGGYEAELELSLRRAPSPHPVWMLNRLLNADITPANRAHFLSVLKSVITHPNATESARERAEEFLEHQQG
jgi:hypothetical protein